MLRIELSTQLRRLRTLVALVWLAAVPVVAALATASDTGHRNGTQGGLFGAAPYSALNHVAAGLKFVTPLLLPLVVALLANAIASSDRDWGTLRYLYVQPVAHRDLLRGKLAATAIASILSTGTVLAAGLIAGLVIFGWHPFHVIGAPSLSGGEAAARLLAAAAYVALCMLALGAISFAIGLALPRGAEALATSVAFVVVAAILNGQSQLDLLNKALPVHYWQTWEGLLERGPTELARGIAVEIVWLLIATGAAIVVLRRRDPAA